MLNRAVNAADETNRANVQTELEMAVSAVIADWSGARYVNGSNESLEDYMTKERVESNMNTTDYSLKEFELNTENGVVVGYKDKDYNFTVEITSSGNSAKVIYNGNSEESGGGSGSDEEEPPIEIDYEYGDVESYGDYVDYPIDLNEDGNTTNDWRIFYNDGEHIFIIAADYVKSDSEYLDLSAAEMHRLADDSNYSGEIYSVNWDNNGSTLTNGGHSSINQDVANLFMYNKYLSHNSTSSNINAKATASLLNVTAWDGFIDSEGYGQYAIGGPTLEMWVASYNSKGYTPLYIGVGDTGYLIGNTENPTTTNCDFRDDQNSGYKDSLYILDDKNDINNCTAYWLASPSNGGSSVMNYVHYVDCVSVAYSRVNACSVRPLVCLNSEVTAEYENNVWNLSVPNV